MPTLSYIGAAQANQYDVVTQSYAQSLYSLDLPQATVTTLLTTGFAPYVTQTYVNQTYVNQSATANATEAFIDAGDATRLHIAQIGVNNGIAGLNPNGKVDISRVTLNPNAQRFPKPFTSPTAYNTTSVSAATSTESQLYTCNVADPMFNGVANSPYKLMVHGIVETQTSVDGEYAIVRVRQGSSTGQIVGTGASMGELYTAGIPTSYTSAGTDVYTIPTWAQSVDGVVYGGGGGGARSVYAQGQGGLAGASATITYNRGGTTSGTTFGTNLSTLNITVGAGGTAGLASGGSPGSGGSSQISAPGLTTVTAAGGNGGANSFNWQGAGAPGIVYDGQSYLGSAIQATAGTGGNAPSGGGSSGAFGSIANGGAGADGAVYLYAKPANTIPGSPVDILPTAFNAQTPITGATVLYVMMVRSGTTSTQVASTNYPGLHVVPIPA